MRDEVRAADQVKSSNQEQGREKKENVEVKKSAKQKDKKSAEKGGEIWVQHLQLAHMTHRTPEGHSTHFSPDPPSGTSPCT